MSFVVSTILNERVDIGWMQYQLMHKFSSVPIGQYIIGSIIPKHETERELELWEALKVITDKPDVTLVRLQTKEYADNINELMAHMDKLNPSVAMFVEEDVVASGTFDPAAIVGAASDHNGKTMRVWSGQHPDRFDASKWKPIGHIRVNGPLDLLGAIPVSAKEIYHPDSCMEIFNSTFLHIDKSSSPHREYLALAKQAFLIELCKVFDIQQPDNWFFKVSAEITDEMAARHVAFLREQGMDDAANKFLANM